MSYDEKLTNSGGDWSFRNPRRPDNIRDREEYNNRKRENIWNEREDYNSNPNINNNNFYPNNQKRRKLSEQDVEPGEITPKFKPRNYDNVMESPSQSPGPPVRVPPFQRVPHHKKPEFNDQIDRQSRILPPRDDIYHRQPPPPPPSLLNIRRDRFRDPNFRGNRSDQYYNENEKFNFSEKEREMVYERDNFREHDIVENSNYDFPDRNTNFRDSIPPRDRNNWNSWRSDRDQRDRDTRDIPQNLSIRGGGVRKQRNWTPDARDKDFNRMRELNRRHTSINLLDNRKTDFQRFRSSAPNIPHIKEDLNQSQNNEGMMEDPFHKKRWENGNINPIPNNNNNNNNNNQMEHRNENAQSIAIGGPMLQKVAPVSAMKDFKNKKDKAMENESPVREE